MTETRLFWIPDYYERFRCKAGRCRTSCCHGWNVTISQQDYFDLLGIACSEQLRSKLDVALHPVQDPDPQRFAQISHDWLGKCPIQREDGLCALQVECGEAALPSTCRYYPRGIRTAFADECCCSGSCEGVLENMFESHEPIRMLQRPLSFDLPLAPRAEGEQEARDAQKIQREWIMILQDRRYSLPERMRRLGCAVHALRRGAGDPISQMEQALSEGLPQEQTDVLPAFAIQRDFLFAMRGHSESMEMFAGAAIRAMQLSPEGDVRDGYARYRELTAHFDAVLPDWQIYFEHMLVNHVLYQGYPYSVRHESAWDEFMALCALYAALRVLSVGYMAEREEKDDFVDVCAAVFKLFEQAEYDHNAMVILRRRGLTQCQDMMRFALL